jgi:hypothetical protein
LFIGGSPWRRTASVKQTSSTKGLRRCTFRFPNEFTVAGSATFSTHFHIVLELGNVAGNDIFRHTGGGKLTEESKYGE